VKQPAGDESGAVNQTKVIPVTYYVVEMVRDTETTVDVMVAAASHQATHGTKYKPVTGIFHVYLLSELACI